MVMTPSDIPAHVYDRAAAHYTISGAGLSKAGVSPDRFDVMQRIIDSITVGEAHYRLRSPCRARFFPNPRAEAAEVFVEGFGRHIVGKGPTIDAAIADWNEQVHVAFQALLDKRPFEMSDEDAATWELLSDRIDVPVYKNSTPLLVRQFGRLESARPQPNLIQWENGSKEQVRLEQMPREFATFKPGQWFQAIAARDPTDFGLLTVLYVQRAPTPGRPSRDAIAAIWKEMETTAQLADAEWD